VLSSEERSLLGRLGAYTLHSTHDSQELARKSCDTLLRKIEQSIDPQGSLPAQERQRRVYQALKAHYTRMALKSAKVRREKAASKKVEANDTIFAALVEMEAGDE
jgi:hypothetical protein